MPEWVIFPREMLMSLTFCDSEARPGWDPCEKVLSQSFAFLHIFFDFLHRFPAKLVPNWSSLFAIPWPLRSASKRPVQTPANEIACRSTVQHRSTCWLHVIDRKLTPAAFSGTFTWKSICHGIQRSFMSFHVGSWDPMISENVRGPWQSVAPSWALTSDIFRPTSVLRRMENLGDRIPECWININFFEFAGMMTTTMMTTMVTVMMSVLLTQTLLQAVSLCHPAQGGNFYNHTQVFVRQLETTLHWLQYYNGRTATSDTFQLSCLEPWASRRWLRGSMGQKNRLLVIISDLTTAHSYNSKGQGMQVSDVLQCLATSSFFFE